jgi:hypothetical protein
MVSIVWSTSPSDLADNLDKWGEKVLQASKDAMNILAPRLVESAQSNAPWNDITGDARAGLSQTTILSDESVSVTLYHSVYYGIFLEVCNGGKYRIIVPTIIEIGPLYWSILRGLL